MILIRQKLEIFKNGYKQPTVSNIKFQNTVDSTTRIKILELQDINKSRNSKNSRSSISPPKKTTAIDFTNSS